MTGVIQQLSATLSAAHALVDELQSAPLDLASDDELLACWRELERLVRRLPTVEFRLIQQAQTRGLPSAAGQKSMVQFLRGLLRLDPQEAKGRVAAAEAAGPRVALTGEALPPVFPEVAAAQQAGAISSRHARVIVSTIDTLPDPVQAEHGVQVETELVEHAKTLDPAQLGKVARRVVDYLDPDGILADVEHRAKHRGLTLHRRPDGSGQLEGELTPECAERLAVLWDALAAPKPGTDGIKDPRSAGQRRHDGLLDGLRRLETCDCLPSVGGVAAQLVLTMTETQYATRSGLATTGHGALIPVGEALDWAGADRRVLGVVMNSMHEITRYSHNQRSFTEQQRLALIARDGGCSFPGCDAPPAWTQAHHVIPYADGGPTSLDNATLICGPHHREHHKRLGWTVHMTNGKPGWSPPTWLDKQQQPRFNALHQRT